MKTYKLTSPPMRGDEVKTLQRRLAGANTFKENYRPGSIDGVFGEGTAGACYRAKWALGYPKDELKRTYGPTLDKFLTGKVQLPADYKRRRTDRKRAATQVPLRVKALNEAKKHIGVKESPAGSNRVQFSVWYGLIGPWCAMFATYCYVTSGSKAMVKGSRYAYVPYIVSAARLGGQGLAIVKSPLPGDLVWDGGDADHVGLFEKWNSDGSFSAIEGNTSTANNSNGGQVMRRNRKRNLVEAFVRVSR
jgi:CHAP domain-containing protein